MVFVIFEFEICALMRVFLTRMYGAQNLAAGLFTRATQAHTYWDNFEEFLQQI